MKHAFLGKFLKKKSKSIQANSLISLNEILKWFKVVLYETFFTHSFNKARTVKNKQLELGVQKKEERRRLISNSCVWKDM